MSSGPGELLTLVLLRALTTVSKVSVVSPSSSEEKVSAIWVELSVSNQELRSLGSNVELLSATLIIL